MSELLAVIVSGMITILVSGLWARAQMKAHALEKKTHALEKEMCALTYQTSFTKKKLEALEKHFGVAPYATRDSNIVIGMGCSGCGADYTICEDRGSTYTTVCPKCFKIKSAFERK